MTRAGAPGGRAAPPELWLVGLTLATSLALFFDHRKYGAEILWRSRGVATGHAEWRVYQNRILGPFLVDASARLLHLDYGAAFCLFVAGSLLAANLIAYYSLAGRGRYRAEALRYCVLLNAGFLAVQVRPFLYEWDCIDLIVFHLLVVGAVARKPPRFFVGVFLLELFNREAAAFVGLYLVADGVRAGWRPFGQRILRSRVLLGVALCAVSVVVTEALRRWLLLEAPRDTVLRTVVLGQHWQVARNLRDLARPGFYKSYALPWLVFGLCAVVWTRDVAADRRAALPLGAVYAAITASLVLFSVLQETRVLIPYLPFLLLLRLDRGHRAFLRHARVAACVRT